MIEAPKPWSPAGTITGVAGGGGGGPERGQDRTGHHAYGVIAPSLLLRGLPVAF
tara:strand:+ start:516 stop:677 length:162 start_codon:yes stop_codon:yes gene_type:complete